MRQQHGIILCGWAWIGLLSVAAPAQKPELMVQTGHSARVTCVAFSPDGHTLASASWDNTVRLWDVASGRELRTLAGHTMVVSSLAFSPDGRTLVSGSFDKKVKLWDVATGRELRTLAGHRDFVGSVSFSSDGHTLASGSSDKTVKLWDVASGRELRTLAGHTDLGIDSVPFSPDGHTLASPSLGKTVSLWDVATGRKLRILTGHTDLFGPVAYSPDGRTLASGSGESAVQLWDVVSGRELRTLVGHTSYVMSVAFSPDGRTLASGSDDHTIKLWDVASGRELLTLVGHTDIVNRVAFSPDGRTLAEGNEGTIKLWDLGDGREPRTLGGRTDQVMSVAFSPDGRTLASGGDDHTIKLWEVASGRELRTLAGRTKDAQSVAFSPDGRTLASGSRDRTIKLWNVASGRELRTLVGQTAWVESVAYSPDGRTLASWAKLIRKDSKLVSTITFWDVATGSELRTLVVPPVVLSVAFSPDGRVLAGSQDKTVKLWDVASGRELRTLAGHNYVVASTAFSPDGMTLASGSWDTTVKLWDVAEGRELRTLAGHTDGVNSVTYSPDGRTLASGSEDGTVRLWEVARGLELASLLILDRSEWVVSDRAGRFDTSNLDEIRGLSWVFPDQPLRALSPEIFMRDYYEPKLLPRLLACNKAEESGQKACAKEFKPLPPLVSLNRLQPKLEVKPKWADEEARLAKVLVKVSQNSDPTMKNGKTLTDPYDLRVFREGQLVGWAPKTSVEWQLEPPLTGPDAAKNEELDLQRWREKTHIDLEADGTKELSFLVQVPRRTDLKQVTFTAYAFNVDRVKSATASATLKVEEALKPRTGKAYVISVGVNRTESSPNWDLQYAANDARQMSAVVGAKLEATKQFAQVVRIRLVSDETGKQQTEEVAATKVHVQAVLDVLAGRRAVDEQLKKEMPEIEKVEKAQPEDLVLLAFSSHGFTDPRGVFHMVLADVGKGQPQDRITDELQKRTLSSDELSAWLRDVDAGELVMVVDSCHSAATVEAEGFKPGPMGSRGLGQLAYDKGMRILAASKSEQSAVEREGIRHGLLSYALVEEGLKQGLADFQPKDGKILMSEWLAYGEQEVPKLFAEGETKGTIQIKGAPEGTRDGYHGAKQTPMQYQQPALFDFSKNQNDVILSRK